MGGTQSDGGGDDDSAGWGTAIDEGDDGGQLFRVAGSENPSFVRMPRVDHANDERWMQLVSMAEKMEDGRRGSTTWRACCSGGACRLVPGTEEGDGHACPCKTALRASDGDAGVLRRRAGMAYVCAVHDISPPFFGAWIGDDGRGYVLRGMPSHTLASLGRDLTPAEHARMEGVLRRARWVASQYRRGRPTLNAEETAPRNIGYDEDTERFYVLDLDGD